MVSSEKGHSVFIPDLKGKEKEECFDTISASVDVISKENIVGVRRISANFEEFEEIIKLSMYISANSNWRPNFNSIGFILENVLCGLTQFLNGDFLNLFFFLDLFDDFLNGLAGCHDLNYQKLSN